MSQTYFEEAGNGDWNNCILESCDTRGDSGGDMFYSSMDAYDEHDDRVVGNELYDAEADVNTSRGDDVPTTPIERYVLDSDDSRDDMLDKENITLEVESSINRPVKSSPKIKLGTNTKLVQRSRRQTPTLISQDQQQKRQTDNMNSAFKHRKNKIISRSLIEKKNSQLEEEILFLQEEVDRLLLEM